MIRNPLIIAAALVVTACTSSPPEAEEPELNLAGYPPAFRDGYSDGCNSTRVSVGKKRDEPRFKSDSMYAAGWRDGFDICSGKNHD